MNTRSLAMAQTTTLLKNHDFRRLWAAQFTTVAVIYSLSLAGVALVEEKTHSSTQVGLVILSSILPAFLASLVSGAVVDRWGRRRVLMISHLARAVVALAFWAGASFFPPTLALVTVYTVNVAGAIFAQFAMPAELALVPDLVNHDRLLSANALLQLSMLIAEGLGLVVLSPLVISVFGIPAVGLIGAVLYILGVVLVAGLPKDPPRMDRDEGNDSAWLDLVQDMQVGWRTISQDRILRLVAIQATLAATLLLVLLSLFPGLLSRHLGLGVEVAPLIILPGGMGFVLGTYLMSRWEKRLSRQAWMVTGLIGLGTCICLLTAVSAQQGSLSIILPPIVGIGMALALVIVSARVILQERPPAAMRARVIAAQLAMANAAAVLPLLLGGSLADQVGILPVMAVLGFLSIGAGAIGLFQLPNRGKSAK